MGNDASACLFYGFNQSFCVIRVNRLQIDHLNWNVFLFTHFSNFLNGPHQVTISDDCYVWAFIDDFSFLQGQFKISVWNIGLSVSIQGFRLKKYDWIGVSNWSQKQSLGLDWVSGNHHFEAWRVTEVSLRRLRVVQGTVANCAPCWSECQFSAFELSSWSVSVFGGFIDNLIKSRENIITKLYFSNGSMSSDGNTDGKSCNTLFRQRGIENSVDTVLLLEATCAPEDSTEFNILTENFSTWIRKTCTWDQFREKCRWLSWLQ